MKFVVKIQNYIYRRYVHLKENITSYKTRFDNGTDRILNLFGVSVNEVEFCNCGNPSGGHHCYVDENIIECADCGKQLQNQH
jgi:hypothetical protein